MSEETKGAAASQPITSIALDRITRWQVLLPVISSLMAVLTFVFGGLFSAWQTRQSEEGARTAQWRSALQAVAFDEQNLARSAFLLESFDNPDPVKHGFWESTWFPWVEPQSDLDLQRKKEARILEMAMLDRTEQPATFDLIFQDMVGDTSSDSPDDLAQLFQVDAALVEHLQTSYAIAMVKRPPGGRPNFEMFLSNPARYIGTTNAEDRLLLNSTLMLLWELDTFSDSMSCVWTLTTPECPHYAHPPQGTNEMLLMNHAIPNDSQGNPGFHSVSTCGVHRRLGEEGYVCEN